MSKDQRCASNAVSYGGECGDSFANEPVSSRTTPGLLTYRAPEHDVGGALFIPTAMEDKWALFIDGGELILVRSWLREVRLRAPVVHRDGFVEIGPFRGAVVDDDEPATFTIAALDAIIRTHALDERTWPVPLLLDEDKAGTDIDAQAVAMMAMSMFGRRAHFAAVALPTRTLPEATLRIVSALHFAAVKNNVAKAEQLIARGAPVGARDHGGATPLHYVQEPGALLQLLVDAGSSLDVGDSKGATPLMLAVQRERPDVVAALLRAGADARAVDHRGFSALHRAAEMNQAPSVTALLAAGADPDAASSTGHTPRGLARASDATDVLALL